MTFGFGMMVKFINKFNFRDKKTKRMMNTESAKQQPQQLQQGKTLKKETEKRIMQKFIFRRIFNSA